MARMFPIGMQTFAKMRENNTIYVDKTALIYKLAQEGSVYFLSRPRRFGKSLLISTLEAYFKGQKELFSGLAIEKLEKEWIKYPVFRFDLSCAKYSDLNKFNNAINYLLAAYEDSFGIKESPQNTSWGTRLSALIDAAYAVDHHFG